MPVDALDTECGQVLEWAQSNKDSLADILDPENGFAPRLRDICLDRVDAIRRANKESYPGELQALTQEADTWSLLQALVPLRKTAPSLPNPPSTILSQNAFTPTATLAQAALSSSPALQELLVVRDWAQSCAPPPSSSSTSLVSGAQGYRRFTRLRLAHAKRLAGTSDASATRDSEGLVTCLDPDSTNVQPGRALAADDANFEKALVSALFAHVRAGRITEAVALATRAQQPWRAAALRGAELFSWPALDTSDDQSVPLDHAASYTGNPRRSLWKRALSTAALDPKLSATERALYAALAPSERTSAVLRGVCRRWVDLVWAVVLGACERKLSAELEKVGAGAWEAQGLSRAGAGAVNGGDGMAVDGEDDSGEDEEEAWESEWREMLWALKETAVDEGPDGRHPMHAAQLHVILGATDNLFFNFAVGLQEGPHAYNRTDPSYGRTLRFFALLALFLQLVGLSNTAPSSDPKAVAPPSSSNAPHAILSAYLSLLEASHARPLVALYSGALGSLANARYARYLVGLGTKLSSSERRTALVQAREHGLDVRAVASAAGAMSVDVALRALPGVLDGPLPVIPANTAAAVEEENDALQLLIRSIEWTTSDLLPATPSAVGTALEHANVVARYLLGSGRVQSARMFLTQRLPKDLGLLPAASGDDEDESQKAGREEQADKHRAYLRFVNTWFALEVVGAGTKVEKEKVEDVKDQVEKILKGGWIEPNDDEEGDGETSMRKEPGIVRLEAEHARIRKIYVPELVVRLHVLLVESRGEVPGALRSALELANVVADDRYRLYEEFLKPAEKSAGTGGRTLEEYLGYVRAAVLNGLEDRGGSDPWRVVKA